MAYEFTLSGRKDHTMHFNLVGLLFLIAGIVAVSPPPYGNRTVSWILVGIAGLALLIGVG